ncbi:hypothetical protein OB905_11875 [Halobacteria archaeon AArc-dxtr1]|nr:hypothetical protein [Halobacteria archaeon AArc-dxtr1]
MGEDGDSGRILASCDECGAVYAAVELADGSILPIGSRSGCRCGAGSFSRVEGVNGDDPL